MSKKVIIDGITYKAELFTVKNMVIIRGDKSGVFFGELKKEEGKEVTLLNARRLWYWSGSASLSQLAMEGVKNKSSCKFPIAVKEIRIKDVIEVIPCTQEAIDSINSVPIWSA